MTPLLAAQSYAAQGYSVFPVGLDKTPITKHGFKDASTDPALITEWWSRHPLAMIGLVTGRKTDVLLLDVDIKNGKDGRAALKALGLDLSQCPQSVTPSGGSHYFFRCGGKAIRNSESKLGAGLDIRADGGFAIVPPSNPNPKKPGYGWVREIPLSAAPIIPDKIVALLSEKTDELTQECNKIRSAEPGQRNKILNNAAFRIAKIVLAGKLREDHAREQLTLAAREIGLSDDEILNTLNSAFSAREKEKELKAGATQGRKLVLPEIDPWPTEVDGSELIAELVAAIRRHLVLDEAQAIAIALWVLHTHVLDAGERSPRLHLSGPTKRCGKTSLLILIKHLVPRPLSTETMTIAVLFRVADQARPTLLIDEADILLRDNPDLKAGLNAGYEKHGQAIRTTGDDHEVKVFSMWCPVVLAGIGKLPDTLADRSIRITMRRKLKSESIVRLTAAARSDVVALAQQSARWIKDNAGDLGKATPDLPASLNDRAQNCWEPLLGVASLLGTAEDGEEWSTKAFKAAVVLSGDDDEADEAAVALLRDLSQVFGIAAAKQQEADKARSLDLVNELIGLEDRPWREWRKGKPLTQAGLSRLLRPFGIRSEDIHFQHLGSNQRGYHRPPIDEAYTRYCT